MKNLMRLTALSPLLLLCALPAADLAHAASATTKTLAITSVLQEYPGPMARCPGKFGGTITGQGNSALLGRIVFIASDCIIPVGPLYYFSQGKLTIVTVNGDQIFADYSGQLVPTGTGTTYTFNSATFQISGGNGLYNKATGGGTLSGSEDLVTGAGQLQFTGKISYKGN